MQNESSAINEEEDIPTRWESSKKLLKFILIPIILILPFVVFILLLPAVNHSRTFQAMGDGMAPEIHAGDAMLFRITTKVAKDDIVAFRRPPYHGIESTPSINLGRLVAESGARITIIGDEVRLNDEKIAKLSSYPDGVFTPWIHSINGGYQLKEGEFFILNKDHGNQVCLFFGPTTETEIIGKLSMKLNWCKYLLFLGSSKDKP